MSRLLTIWECPLFWNLLFALSFQHGKRRQPNQRFNEVTFSCNDLIDCFVCLGRFGEIEVTLVDLAVFPVRLPTFATMWLTSRFTSFAQR